MFECHDVSPRMGIPQRNVTIISCSRKASSIWRCCKRYTPSCILVASIIESIVSTSHFSVAVLLPALGTKVYFAQEWCPLLPFAYHYLHLGHTLAHSIQHGIAWHGQNNRIIDTLCSVRESISISQEPSVPVVQQLCQLVAQFIL